ncbi:MAG: glycosyltransferase [Actinomycetia bacterium]|nr:glycosyltransferase [Actinomycetes bacterium]
MSQPAVRPSDLHVVMLVGNDAATDTRVRKSALSVARLGCRVTLLAYTAEPRPQETQLGDVRIRRVPVPFHLQDARQARRAHRRRSRVVVGYRDRDQFRAAALRLEARRREAEAGGVGLVSAVRLQGLRVRRLVLRGRAGAQRRLDRLQRTGWRAWDKAWSSTGLGVRWRSTTPQFQDYELAFGPELDRLDPDVIHAHDNHMVGVATLAVARARARGRQVRWVYDAHEWVAGLATYGSRTRRVVSAYAKLEAEYVRGADAVITVSPQLAEALRRRYRLPHPPAVVLNIPPQQRVPGEPVVDVRQRVGLDAGTPLLVYSGAVTTARGLVTALEALTLLPDAHLAVVCVPSPTTLAAQALQRHAAAVGVSDRVHWLDPVAPHQVSEFLSTADVGLIPLLRFPSHDMALTNKLFEYMHGGLPLVVSDCPAQAAFVREHGIGVVHRAGDAADLARAVTDALARRAELAQPLHDEALLHRFTWEAQEEALLAVYRELVGPERLPGEPSPPLGVEPVEQPVRPERSVPEGHVVLGIGPANSAGQGWAWGKAVERGLPETRADVLAVLNDKYDFPADVQVAPAVFARDSGWQLEMRERALSTWTHALLEAGRPVFGTLNGRDFRGDAFELTDAGIGVALVFHGSEVRDPRRHAALYELSPFRDPRESLTARLQGKCDDLLAAVAEAELPRFVSTPDLLDFVPEATWLPVVVDPTVWRPGPPPLERHRPLVVHAPSNAALKGTAAVEQAVRSLVADGLVEYRRLERVAPEEMPDVLADADIVLDQFAIGCYGVLACQAMAAGRVTLGHVHARNRDRVPAELPIVEATPQTLRAVVEGLLRDRDRARAVAQDGPGFVRALHDGTHAAEVLGGFLGR